MADYTKIVLATVLLTGTVQAVCVRANINTLARVHIRTLQEILAEENMLVVLAIPLMHGRVQVTAVFVRQNIHVPENMNFFEFKVNLILGVMRLFSRLPLGFHYFCGDTVA